MHRKANPVLHEKGIGDAGQFHATWGIRAEWAHPIWSDYVVLLYDLKPIPLLPPPVKHDPSYTHEMMLFAVNPDTRLDLTRPLSTQSPNLLNPPNLGYQFTALDDAAALDRIAHAVDLIQRATLSPDTDSRPAWDELFEDGTPLVTTNVKALLAAIGAVRH